MSHNFQEVIDELHRGRDLLTSTSGAQGRLDDVSAVLGNVHSRVSTYCSDAAQDAAKYLAAAQGAIDDLRHCISGYNDANEQLIVAIIGSPTITRASRSIGHSAIELTKFAHTGTLKNAQRTLDPKGTKRGVKRDEALTDLPHLLTIKSTRTQTRSEQEKRSARALS